ncbi:E3 ubiquitin-protein ligase Midline-1-like [Ostrea edulis]|uniref:E3 ubiquitin-protein ligase Midline-1-like n=1 Tax=Ostrea edulis TaxID=37623 RepID=UPI0024AEA47D|nr:E3 ubiquitin-protein ligase Midline-1-like [Ostrea edulis]
MDPRRSAQDVVRCDLCETAIVQMYCDFCHVNLCITCIGKHVADDYDKHKVVPIQNRKSTLIYPKCSTHQNKVCELRCKECDMFVCSLCTAADKHKGHTFLILSEIYNKRKADITKDSEEIENIISPTYEEVVTDLETQITNLDGEYVKFTTVVTKHGEEWHKEIDNVINKMKNEIEEMKIKHLEILKKHLDEIKQIQSLIEQSQITLKEMEESNEVSVTMEYRSKNKEFRKLPPEVRVSLPTFSPNMIDSEQLYKSLGSLIPLSFTTDENGYTLKKAETSPKELMDEPELVTTINTGYENLRNVTCLSEEEFWTSAEVSDMKCFNVQGTVINTIKTKSGKCPSDIAVTSDDDLVYSDWATKTVNKVKSGQIEEVIRLQGWKPGNLCVTSSGDLLVTMRSDDQTQSKVLRYSGSTEKQTIQYDDEGKPLYSGNAQFKYISENRNLDICVADREAGAVVVVNQAGKLRYRYTGHSSTTKNKEFIPRGITTDSRSQILTADCNNHCIHILDQNGQFLCYIDNCDLKDPIGLYVDKSDNLFVAEYVSGNLKKIKYLQ